MSVNWGPCALGDLCVQPETAPGEWVRMETTALGESLHPECAETFLGASLQFRRALIAFGHSVWQERRFLVAVVVVGVAVRAHRHHHRLVVRMTPDLSRIATVYTEAYALHTDLGATRCP